MTGDNEDDKGPTKGPWGSRSNKGTSKGGRKNSNGQSPWGQKPPPQDDIPDVEELLQQAQEGFGRIFSGGGNMGPTDNKKGFWLIGLLIFALWIGTGFYRVLPEENAVLLTFGKWTSTRSEAGLGYHIPWPVQSVMKVNVAFDRRVEIGFREKTQRRSGVSESTNIPFESQMLTGDENIVAINFVVMWRIGDAKKYLFEIRDPETTVKKVSESAMREIIGRSKIQQALTEGRADIEASTKTLIQNMLDEYQSGITVNNVQLLRVDPPEPVVDAFDDVQRARSDKERLKNEAETYHNDIVPRARGEAQKLLQDGEAYREAVLSKAKGEADRFSSIYKAYATAKNVTASRMYIETMQDVMKNSKKVIVGDGKTNSILPYLPLDRLGKKAAVQ